MLGESVETYNAAVRACQDAAEVLAEALADRPGRPARAQVDAYRAARALMRECRASMDAEILS